MPPQDSFTQTIAPVGSALHYALRGVRSPEARRACLAVCAFDAQLDEALGASTEEAVVEARLAWWSTELVRAVAGQANHPVARALAVELAAGRFDLAPLLTLVQVRQNESRGFRPADTGTLMSQALASGGGVARLLADCLRESPTAPPTGSPELDQAIAELGAWHWAVERLRSIGADARRGRLWLPVDALEQADLPASALLSPTGLLRRNPVDAAGKRAFESFDALVSALAERLELRLRSALAPVRALAPRARRPLTPLLMLAAIDQALLGEIRRAPHEILSARISLTPLRMLWAGWRGPRALLR